MERRRRRRFGTCRQGEELAHRRHQGFRRQKKKNLGCRGRSSALRNTKGTVVGQKIGENGNPLRALRNEREFTKKKPGQGGQRTQETEGLRRENRRTAAVEKEPGRRPEGTMSAEKRSRSETSLRPFSVNGRRLDSLLRRVEKKTRNRRSKKHLADGQ